MEKAYRCLFHIFVGCGLFLQRVSDEISKSLLI